MSFDDRLAKRQPDEVHTAPQWPRQSAWRAITSGRGWQVGWAVLATAVLLVGLTIGLVAGLLVLVLGGAAFTAIGSMIAHAAQASPRDDWKSRLFADGIWAIDRRTAIRMFGMTALFVGPIRSSQACCKACSPGRPKRWPPPRWPRQPAAASGR